MRRRDFIAGLGSAAAWPALARAQSGQRRIGVFVVGAPPPARDLEIVQELARLGYVEGRNVTYLLRGGAGESGGHEAAVRELVAQKPEVIVGPGSPFAYTLAAATHDIPIVMTATADPVAIGLTTSMSRPSGNVTGFTISTLSIVSKRLELIRELLPQVRRVGRMTTPLSSAAPQLDEQARIAAGALGLDLMVLPLASGADIATAFATIDREHLAAIITDPDPLTVQFGATIADECLVRDLPLIEAWPSRLQNGALAAYGPAGVENIKGAAAYVDRILKGSKVADLPFEEPTQLKLAINLRTARSIGVNVPPTLLARADDVVE